MINDHSDAAVVANPTYEVSYTHSASLGALLSAHQQTLLISTYQAGKLVSIGSNYDESDELDVGFHNFQRPMGIAVDRIRKQLSVASKDRIWHLKNAPSIAPQLDSTKKYNDCFLTRSSSITGDIQAHEMEWGAGTDGKSTPQLFIVNTLFSCLCTLDEFHSFVPLWRPRFISELSAEDRCHLNGLACLNGRPKYVTAMAESNDPSGWRQNKVSTGCLIDVESDETVAAGFAMPHSPRIHGNDIYLLDSGRGGLIRIDRQGSVETVAKFPGYTRGLAIHDSLAFIGLSRIRETSAFDGVPIADERERLKCGVAVVNLNTRELVGQFEFQNNVSEIFDVRLISSTGSVAVHGPHAADEGVQPIWVVPPSI